MINIFALIFALALVSNTSARFLPPPWAPPPSEASCDWAANAYAPNRSIDGEILGATALGALGGLGIGSIFAASGVGAAVGAVVGVVAIIAVREERYGRIYVAAYSDCIPGRRIFLTRHDYRSRVWHRGIYTMDYDPIAMSR